MQTPATSFFVASLTRYWDEILNPMSSVESVTESDTEAAKWVWGRDDVRPALACVKVYMCDTLAGRRLHTGLLQPRAQLSCSNKQQHCSMMCMMLRAQTLH